ncbi:methionine sulfoxide reductase [Planococcus ruber]|uniref:methionine sulfoxide reductase n=1 Tax=Planococcus ruber TaxID=2027871 RepID=UPI001FEFECD4|nr:methionine sulfoxide reductase [Planococcus ruber]MCJ1907748.1 methionine sulfoxide reductase [Planococcus ruber]
MAQEIYVKKVVNEKYGELYQFLKVDLETGKKEVVFPFAMAQFPEVVPEEEPELLTIQSKRGADAVGYSKASSFVVKQGSKFAASTSPKCPKKYIKLREKLILDKKLVPLHNQLLVMEDIEFDTPMAAMGAAIGGWVRGSHDWKEKNKRN